MHKHVSQQVHFSMFFCMNRRNERVLQEGTQHKVLLLLWIFLEITQPVWLWLYFFGCYCLFRLYFSSAFVLGPKKLSICVCTYYNTEYSMSFFFWKILLPLSPLFKKMVLGVSLLFRSYLSRMSLWILNHHFCADHFHLWCLISYFASHYRSPLHSLPGPSIFHVGSIYKICSMIRHFVFFSNSFHHSALCPKSHKLAA